MFKSTSTFDKLLDKATSHLNLEEPDLVVTLNLNDLIRGKDVQASYALNALKKKFYDKNPNVQLFALQVLESWVKNCGVLIHDELLSSKEHMEELHEIVKQTPNEKVRKKILELIQIWAHAFRGQTKYQAVQDIMNIMKTEGYAFPQLKESDAMFKADTAPNWVDSECCMRCRSAFGLLNRKHHCRACGKIFCDQCSRRSLPLPHLGIEKTVRVCDYCYDTLRKPSSSGSSNRDEVCDLPPEYLNSPLSKEPQIPKKKTEEELREEEELQLAIALSQSESESKNARGSAHPTVSINRPPTITAASAPVRKEPEPKEEEELDPELARYLDRSFWEKKQQKAQSQEEKKSKKPESGILSNAVKRFDAEPVAPQASAPPMAPAAPAANSTMKPYAEEMEEKSSGMIHSFYSQPGFSTEKYVNGETTALIPEMPIPRSSNPLDDDAELTEFVANLRSQLEIFTNRMESDRSRGRSIAVDSSVQTLFMNITSLHSTLLRKTQSLEESRIYFEGLQDKLTQLKDARAALDALREEHYEKIRREEEEAARQRQMQMAHKLAIMRKKKHEYLEYQRQLALQRMQEEERILTMKQGMGPGMPMGYGPGSMPMPGPGPMPGVVMPGYPGPMPVPPNSMPMPGGPQQPGPEGHYSDGSPGHQQQAYYGAPMAPPAPVQQQQPPPVGMPSAPSAPNPGYPMPGYRMPQQAPPPQPVTNSGQMPVPQQQQQQQPPAPAPEPEPEAAPLISFD